MSWQFGLVNNKLAEVFFENKKILGFCYVKESEYSTKKEKGWIKTDTKNLQLTYRKKVFRDVRTKEIIPQPNPRCSAYNIADANPMTLEELEKKFESLAPSDVKKTKVQT